MRTYKAPCLTHPVRSHNIRGDKYLPETFMTKKRRAPGSSAVSYQAKTHRKQQR